MNRLFYFWKVSVIAFLTVDIPLELGGWGTIFHQNFSPCNEMMGFAIASIVTFGVVSVAYLNSGDLK